MKNKYILLFLIVFLFLVSFGNVLAGVKINEIAWMGTDGSSSDEWIEFFNDGAEEIDMDGWVLNWGDKESNNITFEKVGCKNLTKIPANSYLLLGGSSAFDTSSGIISDCIYPGLSLSNEGLILTLKNSLGAISDSVDGSDKWKQIGGSNEIPKKTAQKSGSSWITATGTPKAVNAEYNGVEDAQDINNTSSTDNTETNANYSAHSGSEEISKGAEKTKVSLNAGRDRIVMTESPVYFSGKFFDEDGAYKIGGSFEWSFGDGNYLSGQDVVHYYELPGEYVAILNAIYNGVEYTGRINTKVIRPEFEIFFKEYQNNRIVCLKNLASSEVNLKGWKIVDGTRQHIFYTDILIGSKKELCFSSNNLGIEIKKDSKMGLISPIGKLSTEILLGGETTKGGNGDKAVDKYVDKDKNEEMLAELAILKLKLIDIQKVFLGSRTSDTLKNNKVEIIQSQEKDDVKKENIEKNSVQATSSSGNIIILEENKKISGFWKFFKNIFSN